MKTFVYSLILLLIGLRAEAGNKLMWQRLICDTTYKDGSDHWFVASTTTDTFENIYLTKFSDVGDSSVPIICKYSKGGKLIWHKNLLPLNGNYRFLNPSRQAKMFIDKDGFLVNLFSYGDTLADTNGKRFGKLLLTKLDLNGQVISTKIENLEMYENTTFNFWETRVQSNGDIYCGFANHGLDSVVFTIIRFDKNFNNLYEYIYDDIAWTSYSGRLSFCVRDTSLFIAYGGGQVAYGIFRVNMNTNSILWINTFTLPDAYYYWVPQLEEMNGYLYMVGDRIMKISKQDGSILAMSSDTCHPIQCIFDSAANLIIARNGSNSGDLTLYSANSLNIVQRRSKPCILYNMKSYNNSIYAIGAVSMTNYVYWKLVKIYRFDSLLNEKDSFEFVFPPSFNRIYVHTNQPDFEVDDEGRLILFSQMITYPDDSSDVSIPILIQKFCFDCQPDIQGRVYMDMNNNCEYDSTDYVVMGNAITTSPNQTVLFTDSNGVYDLFFSDSITSIECVPYLNNLPFCNGISSYTVPNSGTLIDTVDFGYNQTKFQYHDVSSKIDASVARPGFNQAVLGHFFNNGTQPLYSTTATMSFDSNTLFISSSLAVDSIVGQTYYFTLDTIPINSNRSIACIVIPNPSTVDLGASWRHISGVDLIGDMNSNNNVDTVSGIFVGSYDPNYISVSPVGITKDHLVENGTTLDYYVEFQNTGTDTAFNVKVIVALDDDLDLTTFRFTGATHPCMTELEGNRISFVFEEILLVDSNKDYDKSIGHLTYRIEPKFPRRDGTYLTAHAAIYFDYNEPVITNTVFNRIGRPGSIFIPDNVDDFNLFPNPSVTNSFKLVVNAISPNYEIVVLDLVGRKIPIRDEQYSYNDKDYHSISVLDAAEGFYFVQMRTPRHVISKKWLYLGD